MPSIARKSFDENAKDIERLLELHQEKGGTFKRGVAEVWKFSINLQSFLLTSFWEAYCEDIAAEGLEHIIKYADTPDSLSKEIKKNHFKRSQI